MPAPASKSPQHSSLQDIRFKALPAQRPTSRRSPAHLDSDVLDRVRCEFGEMRGFSPTVDQAARLFQLSREECNRLLTLLVDEGFLRQTPDGRYRLPPQQ